MRRKTLLPVLVLALAQPLYAAPTADEIVRKIAEQPTPDSSAVKLKMTLVSHRGSKSFEQVRSVEMFGIKSPEGAKSLLRFKEPQDVAGVALLVHENKNAANDQWLYMPALKQDPKRIAGGQKNNSFLGTDFTFADLEGRDPGDWQHQLLREETINGEQAWVIQSTPKEGTESQYTKTVQWVRQKDYLPVKIEFYNKKGLLKVLTVEASKKIDGYTTATKTTMKNVVKNHATILEVLDQKNNLDFPPNFFTTRRMTDG